MLQCCVGKEDQTMTQQLEQKRLWFSWFLVLTTVKQNGAQSQFLSEGLGLELEAKSGLSVYYEGREELETAALALPTDNWWLNYFTFRQSHVSCFPTEVAATCKFLTTVMLEARARVNEN